MLLLEFIGVLPPDTQSVRDLGSLGRYVFDAKPEYDGRMVVEVPTHEILQRLLEEGNGGGRPLYVVPSDLLDRQTLGLVLEVVDARLRELGLFPEPKAPPLPTPAPMATQGTLQAQAQTQGPLGKPLVAGHAKKP